MNENVDHREIDDRSSRDNISLFEVANAILRNWRIIGLLPVVLALIVGGATLMMDRSYSAAASFFPERSDPRAGGSAAALAAQFGMNLGSENAAQSPSFYVDLLLSRVILRQVVEAEYQVRDEGGRTRTATLIELYELHDHTGPFKPWQKAIERLRENISTALSWETGVVHFKVLASDPVLAEQIAARILQLLSEFNQELRQTRAREEGRFVSTRAAEVQAELLTAEEELQEFLRQNREFRNSPELLFEHDRLQRRLLMQQELYTSLLRAQEQARIDAVRDTPLFTVINHPSGTSEPVGRGTVIKTVLAFMVGLMVAVFVALGVEYARHNRESRNPHYKEFQGLTRQTWNDLRNPRRWVQLRRGATH